MLKILLISLIVVVIIAAFMVAGVVLSITYLQPFLQDKREDSLREKEARLAKKEKVVAPLLEAEELGQGIVAALTRANASLTEVRGLIEKLDSLGPSSTKIRTLLSEGLVLLAASEQTFDKRLTALGLAITQKEDSNGKGGDQKGDNNAFMAKIKSILTELGYTGDASPVLGQVKDLPEYKTSGKTSSIAYLRSLTDEKVKAILKDAVSKVSK